MLPFLVTMPQPITTGVQFPKSVYSRVVNLELHIPAGIGNGDFAFTPALGNNIWLLRVDVWFLRNDTGGQIGGFVYIGAGSAVPAHGGVIAMRWDLIVPNYSGAKPGLWWQGVDGHVGWDMRKLYTGEARRFGVSIENFSATLNWVALVSFVISEG